MNLYNEWFSKIWYVVPQKDWNPLHLKFLKKIILKLIKKYECNYWINELQNNNVCVVVQSTMMSRIVDWNKYFIIDLIIDNNNHLIMID